MIDHNKIRPGEIIKETRIGVDENYFDALDYMVITKIEYRPRRYYFYRLLQPNIQIFYNSFADDRRFKYSIVNES